MLGLQQGQSSVVDRLGGCLAGLDLRQLRLFLETGVLPGPRAQNPVSCDASSGAAAEWPAASLDPPAEASASTERSTGAASSAVRAGCGSIAPLDDSDTDAEAGEPVGPDH